MAIIGYVETPYEFPEEGEIATVVLAVFGDLQEDVLVNLRSEDISGIDNAALGKLWLCCCLIFGHVTN